MFLLGLLGILLTLGACSRPAPEVVLRLGLLGTTDDVPYFVMQAEGLDRKHGLRLEPSIWPGGAQIIG